MTPREALYHIVMELGPLPETLRDDNITHKEAQLRDSVAILLELVRRFESESKD